MIQNNVRLIGRLGKDIEIKVAGNHKVAQISLAVRKTKDESEWFYVNVWNNQADYLDQYAKKGSMIAIDGRLAMKTYTDQQGKERNQLQINATEVTILGGGKAETKKEVLIDAEELPFY